METNVIYNGNVSVGDNDEGLNYIGVTGKSIKDRLYKHRNSFKY